MNIKRSGFHPAAQPLLVVVEGALHDVAVLVGDLVELWRAPACRPAALPVSDLVGPLRDHGGDPLAAQQRPVPATGVGLIAQHRLRAGTWSAWPGPFDSEVGQEELQHRRVSGLARGQRDHQGAFAAVDQLMDLGGQPAAGASDRVVGWLVGGVCGGVLVTRLSPL